MERGKDGAMRRGTKTDDKIIKVVRGLTDLGLKEAKDAVTNVPFTILAGKTKGEVEEAKKALEEGGAKCSIK